MRLLSVAALMMVATAAHAEGEDCPLQEASYAQPHSNWVLEFKPVPRDGAANQTAAFTVRMPNSNAALDGAVYVPNGFGQPHGHVTENCQPEDMSQEECTIWQGTMYGAGPAGMNVMPTAPDAVAPRQLLLPEFAANVWYSMRRGTEFVDTDAEPEDVFTLKACAEG